MTRGARTPVWTEEHELFRHQETAPAGDTEAGGAAVGKSGDRAARREEMAGKIE